MSPMSTENEVNEAPGANETAEGIVLEDVSEQTPETLPEEAPEEEQREQIKWPGTTGEGEMRMRFFDIKGLPETLDDEADPTLRMILALIAEVQELRVDNHDLKEAVQYMSLTFFIQQKNSGGASPGRGMPASMSRLISS